MQLKAYLKVVDLLVVVSSWQSHTNRSLDKLEMTGVAEGRDDGRERWDDGVWGVGMTRKFLQFSGMSRILALRFNTDGCANRRPVIKPFGVT